MNYSTAFICYACKQDQHFASNLNKHINICKSYNKWIKTYKPVYYSCDKCNKTYSTNEYLNNHKKDCL